MPTKPPERKQVVIEKPGIYEMSNEDYHSTVALSPITGKLEPIISKSGITRLSRSPAHYKASIEHRKAPTPLMQFGTDAHTCVLEYGRYCREKKEWFETHVVKPKFSGKGAKARREAWEAANAGKVAVTWHQFSEKKEHFKTLERLRVQVMRHPKASQLLKGGRAELSAFWFDEDLQIWLKVRPDHLSDTGVYTEFKTTADARPYAFSRVANQLKYHWHCLYLDVLTALTGYPHTDMWIIAVEQEPPHAVNVFEIDHATLEIGRMQVRQQLKIYAECLKTGKWPAYETATEPLKFSKSALWVDEEVWQSWAA